LRNEDVTAAHGLIATGVYETGTREDEIPERWTHVVDLELRGHHQCIQHGGTNIGQRSIGSVTQHSSVHETILLAELGPDGQPQLRSTA
jgi:hypothetical protein